MDCAKVRVWMSAFLDEELESGIADEVRTHLDQCSVCGARFNEFVELGAVARSLPTLEPSRETSNALWQRIATDLETRDGIVAAIHSTRWWRHPVAIAAILLLGSLLGSSLVFQRFAGVAREERRLATFFERYSTEFVVSPTRAQSILDHEFPFHDVSFEDRYPSFADSSIARNPTITGMKRISVHVLHLPCCECVQALYQRADGSLLTVFEHQRPTHWESQRASRQVQIANCQCRLRQVDQKLAVSWEHDSHYFTVVGASSEDEVATLVASL